MIASALIALAGIALAWWLYVRSPELPGEVAEVGRPVYGASLNKFYFDEIYWAVMVAPLRGLAWLSDWFDRAIIDPAVDAVATIPRGLSRIAMCTTGWCRRLCR